MYGFVISFEDNRPISITCCQCGLTSHNKNDIAHCYCARCGKFHELFVSLETNMTGWTPTLDLMKRLLRLPEEAE